MKGPLSLKLKSSSTNLLPVCFKTVRSSRYNIFSSLSLFVLCPLLANLLMINWLASIALIICPFLINYNFTPASSSFFLRRKYSPLSFSSSVSFSLSRISELFFSQTLYSASAALLLSSISVFT